jgi:hypothetical protein
MTRAIDCKTAKGRAHEAIRQILRRCGARHAFRYSELGRPFDACFEMNDGDDVVRIVIEQAAIRPELEKAIRDRGFGDWLEPDYYARHLMSGPHPFTERKP